MLARRCIHQQLLAARSSLTRASCLAQSSSRAVASTLVREDPPRSRGDGLHSAGGAWHGEQDKLDVMLEDLKRKIGRMGVISLKEVNVRELFKLLRLCRKPFHFRGCLQMMNLFYNFGVPLGHRETSTRLLAAAMRSRAEDEAVEIVKLHGTFLEEPPAIRLVYALMEHFLDAGKPMVVRELAQAVRENPKWQVQPTLYALTIEAMLQVPERPLEEAACVYRDAHDFNVMLPHGVHTLLLNAALAAFETSLAETAGIDADSMPAEEVSEEVVTEDGEAVSDAAKGSEAEQVSTEEDVQQMMPAAALVPLKVALEAARGLARDGHLLRTPRASSLCSMAWLNWHVSSLDAATKLSLELEPLVEDSPRIMICDDWQQPLMQAMENFGSEWGFSIHLPRGLFKALEASSDTKAVEMVKLAKACFGHFYPEG
mmetsp:Transcript_27370/g.63163  ORF Transcript_27370/g.63163 Transcript_27370/m.63163 type:complete len:428 (-) Transcript_27370:82-1365(-)